VNFVQGEPTKEVRSTKQRFARLITVLSFFAALRNYGYVDRLGNSLDEVTALEAVKDAIRDYHSLCLDSKEKCVETRVGGEEIKLKCPDVTAEELARDFNEFLKAIEGKPGSAIVKITRRISLEALAEKEILRSYRC